MEHYPTQLGVPGPNKTFTHCDCIRCTSIFKLQGLLHTLRRLWWAWFIVVELVRLYSNPNHFPSVDIHPIGRWWIKKFMRRGWFGTWEPEVCAFIWITWKVVIRSDKVKWNMRELTMPLVLVSISREYTRRQKSQQILWWMSVNIYRKHRRNTYILFHLRRKTSLWRASLQTERVGKPPVERRLVFRNTTHIRKIEISRCINRSPLYHKKPSPYLTLPSPTSERSNTHIHKPTSCSTRFAYFLFSSFVIACSAGRPKFVGWTATVSWYDQKSDGGPSRYHSSP